MKVAVAADHGGLTLKNHIVKKLQEDGHEVVDLGTKTEESVDYPEYGFACGEAVAKGEADRGIVCCGTGIGISIAANKVEGIRCALCTDTRMARLARQHNDANMLALGGRTLATDDALDIVETWMTTDFEGGRHARRVGKIDAYMKGR